MSKSPPGSPHSRSASPCCTMLPVVCAGPEINGTPGTSAWLVQLDMTGELLGPNADIKLALPPIFVINTFSPSTSRAVTLKLRIQASGSKIIWTSRIPVSSPTGFQRDLFVSNHQRMRRDVGMPPPSWMRRLRTRVEAWPIDRVIEAVGQLRRSTPNDDDRDQIKLVRTNLRVPFGRLTAHWNVRSGPAAWWQSTLVGAVAAIRTFGTPGIWTANVYHWRSGLHWAEIYRKSLAPVGPAMRRLGPDWVGRYIILGFNDNLVRATPGVASLNSPAIDLRPDQQPPSWARRAGRAVAHKLP